MQHALQLIDPAELARISDLELLARTVVEGFLTGMHRSPHSGASIEFAQYRPYAQGDDLRAVDWKLYGRTDRLHVKQYQEETNLRCTILIDCSASMDYASGPVLKFQYARMLSACLATLLSQQHDAFGLLAYHEEILSYLPPRADIRHLRRVVSHLERLEPAGPTDTGATLRALGEMLSPRGMVVLISDLLHPIGEMIDHLKSLRARRHDVLVLQISDPAELTFPFDRTQTFIDAEDAREIYAVPDAVREGYLENRRNHFETIRRECLSAEIDIDEFVTSEPLDRALNRFMYRRNHALTTNSSRRGRGAGRR